MRNFVIWSVVLLATAGNACRKEPQPTENRTTRQEAVAAGQAEKRRRRNLLWI